MIKKKKITLFIPNIVYVLVLGLIARVIFSGFGTLQLDYGTFTAWSHILANGGFKNFYNGWSDYLPGYLYVLWLLGKISIVIPQVLLYKLPAILADLATGFLIYKILIKNKSEKWALMGSAIYLFNPAIFANSSLWGQVDSFVALFALLSIYVFSNRYWLSAIFLSLGTLIKPQTAFILPIILLLMLKNKWSIKKTLVYLFIGLSVFILGFVPFWNHGDLTQFVFERLNISLNQYPYTSINAFNFWGLFGFWKPDNIYFQMIGYVSVLATAVFLSFRLWKNKLASYYLLSFIFSASFVFFTRMHERHLLPVFAPLAIIVVENPIFLIPYLGFSLIYIANLYYSYQWITKDFIQVFPDIVLKFLSVISVGLTIFVFYSISKKIKVTWNDFRFRKQNYYNYKEFRLPTIKFSKINPKIILATILVFAFTTRVFNLNSPKNEYFDEVYHAFTARVILHNDPKAWEWWNTPPEGFAYEWTHPPLAKLGMVMGMKIFGENSFGWRVPGALLSVGSVFLVYLLAKLLFKDEVTGLLSAAVFSLDGLVLVMSRIGMNDSYLLFFVLLSIYFFLRENNFWSAIAFGLALASKWSAIWAIPILGILWLRRKKKFEPSMFLSFIVLPFSVYILSYLQMFLTGHDLSIWWGMQKQMWWYHTGLRATHAYSSAWWSWPLLVRPIYLYTSDEVGGMVSRIYAIGNPVVFWFGLSSVIISFIYAFIEKNLPAQAGRKLAFVVFAYLIFFVPWAISPRIMFLYHYLPSIPFLAIATGYVLRRNPKLIFIFLTFAFLAFVYFYPHWAGLQIPLWLDKSYYWISSWR